MNNALEKKILTEYRTVAIVGISADPARPSNRVARNRQGHGFNITPVNPAFNELFNKQCYPDLSSIQEKVEIADVFRNSSRIEPVIDEAIKIGAKVIWIQEGVVNKKAADKAIKAGLLVVMNKCMFKEHNRLFPGHNND